MSRMTEISAGVESRPSRRLFLAGAGSLTAWVGGSVAVAAIAETGIAAISEEGKRLSPLERVPVYGMGAYAGIMLWMFGKAIGPTP